ncbi:DUF3334 family protein [Desulfobacterales bacterium HSG17]|nr:DUF3334 family protein [Desulfobacterales bacterium HSG17]
MSELSSIDLICGIFCKSAKSVLERNTKRDITFSPTIQDIPKVSLKPAIGSFVQFTGDYNGLAVFNFSADAAMLLYKSYMMGMGLPENELSKEYTSDEVPNTIGEMTNQIMGQAMSLIEEKYELNSYCGQPKALSLNSALTLSIDSDYRENRRIVFHIDNFSFQMEVALETIKFISIASVLGK